MPSGEQVSDRRRAFEAEALPHAHRLYAAARRLAGAGIDAEDLVQETFLRAYRTYDNFTPGTNCRAWLLTILHSIYVNRIRRMRHEPQAQPVESLELHAQRALRDEDWEVPLLAAAAASKWGASPTVREALRRLPEEYRTTLVLVDVEELTYEEAAAALDCPVGTVRSRLSRARRQLALALADYARELGYPEAVR